MKITPEELIAELVKLVIPASHHTQALEQPLAWQTEQVRAELRRLQSDSARLDWLEAHPLQANINGGADDGGTAKVWAISAHPSHTLRIAIDAVRKA
jgi:hypothetical protein